MWYSIGLNIQKYWVPALGLASYVGAAFLQQLLEPLFNPWHPNWSTLGLNAIAFLVVGVTIVAVVAQARDSNRLAGLKTENQRLQRLVEGLGNDFFDVWHTYLSSWSKQLGFSGSERISLYKWSRGSFIMLGRYAENRLFSERGRGVYPQDQGCIGQAWSSDNGYSIISDLPDPQQDHAAYVDAQERACSMPANVLENLSMKPRSIAAYVIKDTTDTRRSAIVVFESTQPGRINALDLASFLQGDRPRQLTLLMEAMKNQEPSLELAAEEGF